MTRALTAPSRPALRYFGGKWRLAPWVIAHFPPHVCYVEPYAGGASVLLSKPRSEIEVYNDADSEVVNFFRVLRERTDEFIRAIELTPFAREEVDLSYQPADDELERARRFYIRCWQTRGGPRGEWRNGWRFSRRNVSGALAIRQWQDVGHLGAVATRLKGVQIEHDDALAVIRRYDTPNTLFYCDPPYLASVRGKRWRMKAYKHEPTEEDHRQLAATLVGIEGHAIVSGYPSPEYREWFPGWTMVFTGAVTDTAAAVTEALWISPRAAGTRQGNLFAEVAP